MTAFVEEDMGLAVVTKELVQAKLMMSVCSEAVRTLAMYFFGGLHVKIKCLDRLESGQQQWPW